MTEVINLADWVKSREIKRLISAVPEDELQCLCRNNDSCYKNLSANKDKWFLIQRPGRIPTIQSVNGGPERAIYREVT